MRGDRVVGYAAIRAAEMVEAGLRQVSPSKCPRCNADTLTGDDDDKCAFHTTADTEPVDRLGEVFAIIDRLGAYDIVPARGKGIKPGTFKMYSRFGQHRHWDHPVLIQHACNRRRP